MFVRLFTLLICIINLKSVAQSYGQDLFVHSGSRLSKAIQTNSNNPGFLRAGFKASSINGTYNFCIEKSDLSGQISGAGSFNMDYKIMESNLSCSGSPSNQPLNCNGISMLETSVVNGTQTASYAGAGTYSSGVFFFTLNNSGIPVTKKLYQFPTAASNIKKPFITESKISPNNYFITGSVDTMIYALKVDAAGTLLWSSFFNSGDLESRGVMECPYTNDVLIIGHASLPLSYNKTIDGFLLKLNPSTGNINSYQTYGDVGCQGFSSIAVANSTLGGQGFILGGESDPVTTMGRTWFVKLSSNGTMIWNKIAQPLIGSGAFPIADIFEKQTGSSFCYYGVASEAPYGMVVLKLDESGNPYSGSNEFVYKTSNFTSPVNMINTNSGSSQGITVFGIDNFSNPNAFFMVKADYDGQSSCQQTLTTINQTETIASTTSNPWIIQSGSLTVCSNFDIKETSVSSVTNSACVVTEINSISADDDFKVYPNPATDNCFISLGTNTENLSIEITDIQNRTIAVLNTGPSTKLIEIPLKDYDLASGVYLLKILHNNSVFHRKIVYKK